MLALAKVSLNKVAPVKKIPYQEITVNDVIITVEQYLPMDKKAEFLSKTTNEILDSRGIVSALRTELFSSLYIVYYYTNINLTETMLNNASATYDTLKASGVIDAVMQAIPEEELNAILDMLDDTLVELSRYRTSALGVFDIMKDAKAMEDVDAQDLVKQLQELSNDSLLQGVLDKLG